MKNAQSPITTLGIPASSSTAKDSGPRRKPSRASSARKSAAPSPIGNAMTIPIAEVTNVPYKAGRAPNVCRTGSQVRVTKKPRPKRRIAGSAGRKSATMKIRAISRISIAEARANP